MAINQVTPPKKKLTLTQRFFNRRPYLEQVFCHFAKAQRMTLPSLSLPALFSDFDQHPIKLYQLAKGGSSSPLVDVVMLLKVALCTKPNRLMEVGSFRGYTALYLAQHVAPEAKIVTIDIEPQHGEAYRDTPFAAMIERRVGAMTADIIKQDAPGSYDLIFLDADHSYAGVKNDTPLLLPLLAPDGYFVWHDYANWGYFNARNGVPEYLKELTASLPIAHIEGSNMAIYSPAWANSKKSDYQNALQSKEVPKIPNRWASDKVRG